MKKYLLICNIRNAIILTILFLVGMLFYSEKMNMPLFAQSMIIILIFTLFVSKAILNTKYWKYSYDNEKITYTRGFYAVTKTVIPLMRIQQIVTINNPLLNRYNLVKLSVITTTATHSLLPIPKNESEEIIKFITAYLQRKSGTCDEK